MSELSERLKNLREEKGISMDKMCEDLSKIYNMNLAKSTISKWENGKSEPTMSYARVLAKYFDVSLDYIIGLTNEKSDNQKEQQSHKITDVKQAMDIIMSQPGLMLNGEMLSDESKIALANAINMGLAYAKQMQEKEKEKKQKRNNDKK